MENTEPPLPSTPTFEGRKPELKNLGYAVDFIQLWPLLLGVVVSATLIFAFTAFHWRPVPWWGCVLIAPCPLLGSHLYLKRFVENARPHAQSDFLARMETARLDWANPLVRWCPFIPSVRFELTIAAGPVGGLTHPMLRLAQKTKEHAKTSGKLLRRR